MNERDAGYLEALGDLLQDNVLSLEEYQKRKEARMAKKISDTTPVPDFLTKFRNELDEIQTKKSTSDVGSSQPATNTFGGSSNFNIQQPTPMTFGFPQLTTQTVPKSSPYKAMYSLPSEEPAMRAYSICLLGNSGVGKTTFVQRFLSGTFGNDYKPTTEGEVHSVTFMTNKGPMPVNVYDTAVQEGSKEARQGFSAGADAYIIMFDVTLRSSYKDVPIWYKEAIAGNPSAAIALVGNKVDRNDRTVKPKSIIFHRRKNLMYYDISAKSNYNIEKPFLYLLRKLTNDVELCLVESPVRQSPSVMLSMEAMQQYAQQFQQANAMPLIDDDDHEI